MIVAITGGRGFVGRRLVNRLLQDGHIVRILTRQGPATALPQGAQVFVGDLTGAPKRLTDFVGGAAVVYHCAGNYREESAMEALHVGGTRQLIEAAAGRVGRLVLLSSVGVYGPRSAGLIDERTSFHPQGIYETTKARSEELVAEAGAKGKIEYSILRPSNVFGPEMPARYLFDLIGLIRKRLFIFIGPPGALGTYVHVDNVVDALCRCALAPEAAGEAYNVSDQRNLEEITSLLAAELGVAPPFLRLPLPLARAAATLLRPWQGCPLTHSRISALTNRARYLTTKIERALNYRHPVALEEGMRQMVRAARDPLNASLVGGV